MRDNDFRIWLSKTISLTDDQAWELITHLKKIGKTPHIEDKTYTLQDDWLLPGIEKALLKHNIAARSSLYIIRKSKEYKSYRRYLPDVLKELTVLLPSSNSRYKSVLANLAGEALIDWCRMKRVPMIATKVIEQVKFCNDALERAFPGYISAGVFYHILEMGDSVDLGVKR